MQSKVVNVRHLQLTTELRACFASFCTLEQKAVSFVCLSSEAYLNEHQKIGPTPQDLCVCQKFKTVQLSRCSAIALAFRDLGTCSLPVLPNSLQMQRVDNATMDS